MSMGSKKYQELAGEFFTRAGKEKGDLVMDGPICWEQWWLQPIRILFYYKETYGYGDSGGPKRDFGACYGQWVDDGIKTACRIALMAWAILEQLASKTVDESQLRQTLVNRPLLRSVLPKIAHVNVKKLSNKISASNDGVVRDASKVYGDLLARQLELLDPHIIVCGGTVTWHSLIHDTLLFEKVDQQPKPCCAENKGKILCHFNHVASRSNPITLVHNYSTRVVQAWNALHPKDHTAKI